MRTDAPDTLMMEDDEILLEFYEAALASEYKVLTATGFGAVW